MLKILSYALQDTTITSNNSLSWGFVKNRDESEGFSVTEQRISQLLRRRTNEISAPAITVSRQTTKHTVTAASNGKFLSKCR